MVLDCLLDRWRERGAADGDRVAGGPRDLRIVRLLKEHGGRVTQTAIVDELDVSRTTISRDLDALEADGIVTRRPFGRTNIVELERDGAVDALVRRGKG